MRFPFFRPRRAGGPIRLTLPEMLHFGYGVYFESRRPSPPAAEDLKPVVMDWVDRHAREPLRSAINEYVSRGLLTIEVGPKDLLPLPPADYLRLWQPCELEERRFEAATHMLVVGTVDMLRHPLIGFWTGLAGARALADASTGVIMDPEFPRLLPITTHTERFPEDADVPLGAQIRIPYSVDRRGLGLMTTKGMTKFGLPELEFRDLPPNKFDDLTAVMNGMARMLLDQALAQAAEREEPAKELILEREVRFTLENLFRAYPPEEHVEPREGARGWTTIRLEYRPAKKNEPEWLTLTPPEGFRGSQGVWVNSLLNDLFGVQDTLRQVKTDSEAMEAAHLQAVSELPAVKERFQTGLKPGETLIVKHGFPTRNDEHEYMWLVVNTWQGDRLRTQLANDPQIRLDLRSGQEVELREEDIFDWAVMRPDGSMEGGNTNRVVAREGQGNE